jgi:hypothetical protein
MTEDPDRDIEVRFVAVQGSKKVIGAEKGSMLLVEEILMNGRPLNYVSAKLEMGPSDILKLQVEIIPTSLVCRPRSE